MKLKEISLNMHINEYLNFSSLIMHPSILSICGHNGYFLVFLGLKIQKCLKLFFLYNLF